MTTSEEAIAAFAKAYPDRVQYFHPRGAEVNEVTPYTNEDYDELWIRKDQASYQRARSEAAMWAREWLGSWGRSRYLGKVNTELHECEYWPCYFEDDDEREQHMVDHPECGHFDAYHFELYEP